MAILLVFGITGTPAATLGGLSFEGLRATLAPGLAGAAADRVVLTFAFAQLVHYSVWLFLIPVTLASSSRAWVLRDLGDDFGGSGRAAILVAVLALPILGLLDPAGARSAYLSLVLFHGWLEVAMIVHWLLRPSASQPLEARA